MEMAILSVKIEVEMQKSISSEIDYLFVLYKQLHMLSWLC
jgi:hypothetical protein